MASPSYVHSIVGRFEGSSKDARRDVQIPIRSSEPSKRRTARKRRSTLNQETHIRPQFSLSQHNSDKPTVDNVTDATSSEDISVLDPRKFTSSLHASLVAEILALRRDQEAKASVIEDLETCVYAAKSGNEALLQESLVAKRETSTLRQQIIVLESESLFTTNEHQKQQAASLDMVNSIKERLAKSVESCQKHEVTILQMEKSWKQDKDYWIEEKRKMDRRVHVAETRLKLALKEITANALMRHEKHSEASTMAMDTSRTSIQSFASYGRSLASPTPMSDDETCVDAGNLNLADELALENMGECSDNEDTEFSDLHNTSTPQDGAMQHGNIRGRSSNNQEAICQHVEIGRHKNVACMTDGLCFESPEMAGMGPPSDRARYVDSGVQFTPPTSPGSSPDIVASLSSEHMPIASIVSTASSANRGTQTELEEPPMAASLEIPLPTIFIRPPTSGTTGSTLQSLRHTQNQSCQVTMSDLKETKSAAVQTDSLPMETAGRSAATESHSDPNKPSAITESNSRPRLLPSVVIRQQGSPPTPDLRDTSVDSAQTSNVQHSQRPYRISGLFSGLRCDESSDDAEDLEDTESPMKSYNIRSTRLLDYTISQGPGLKRGRPTITRKGRQVRRSPERHQLIPALPIVPGSPLDDSANSQVPYIIPVRASSRRPIFSEEDVQADNSHSTVRHQHVTSISGSIYGGCLLPESPSEFQLSRFSWQIQPDESSALMPSLSAAEYDGTSAECTTQITDSQESYHDRPNSASSVGSPMAEKPGLFSPQATAVVDAVAQTMVGEWMYKYVRRRKSFGISDKDAAYSDKYKVRHRRWVWLAPYDRAVMWSSKQPSSGSALLGKSGRKLNIQSVLDIEDNSPIPKGETRIFNRSILVLTPSRALKFTAMTKERHDIWCAALAFLARSSEPDPETLQSPPTFEAMQYSPQYNKDSFDMPSIPKKSARRKRSIQDSFKCFPSIGSNQDERRPRHGRSCAISKHRTELSPVLRNSGIDQKDLLTEQSKKLYVPQPDPSIESFQFSAFSFPDETPSLSESQIINDTCTDSPLQNTTKLISRDISRQQRKMLEPQTPTLIQSPWSNIDNKTPDTFTHSPASTTDSHILRAPRPSNINIDLPPDRAGIVQMQAFIDPTPSENPPHMLDAPKERMQTHRHIKSPRRRPREVKISGYATAGEASPSVYNTTFEGF